MGYFIHGEPTEIAEFDGFAFSRIELLECIEAGVEGQEILASFPLKAVG